MSAGRRCELARCRRAREATTLATKEVRIRMGRPKPGHESKIVARSPSVSVCDKPAAWLLGGVVDKGNHVRGSASKPSPLIAGN